MKRSTLPSAVLLVAFLGATHGVEAANKTAVARCTEAAENGQRLRANGELRAAVKQLGLCVAHECPSVVRRDCGKWLEETVDATPSIVIKVVDAQGHDVSVGQLYFDDELASDKLDGRAISIDPGSHRVAYVNGTQRIDEELVIREGERNRAVLLRLPAPPRAEPPPKSEPPHESPIFRAPPAVRASASPWPWVLGGAGVAAGALGGIFWYLGADAHDSMANTCAPTHTCKDDAVHRARADLVAGDILVGIGVVALTTAVIWLVARAGDEPAPVKVKDSSAHR